MSAPSQDSPSQDSRASEPITALLVRLSEGDREVEARLAPRVYAELRRPPSRHMRRERANHTLQATALVNEAWLRLMELPAEPELGEPGAFFRRGFPAHAADSGGPCAQAAGGKTRGPAAAGARSTNRCWPRQRDPVEILALDQALERFKAIDARGSRVLELHFFGGLVVR